MPIVTIKVTGQPVTDTQRASLIKGATDLLEQVLQKPPEITWVLIDEVPVDNWGVGGRSVRGRLGQLEPDAD